MISCKWASVTHCLSFWMPSSHKNRKENHLLSRTETGYSRLWRAWVQRQVVHFASGTYCRLWGESAINNGSLCAPAFRISWWNRNVKSSSMKSITQRKSCTVLHGAIHGVTQCNYFKVCSVTRKKSCTELLCVILWVTRCNYFKVHSVTRKKSCTVLHGVKHGVTLCNYFKVRSVTRKKSCTVLHCVIHWVTLCNYFKVRSVTRKEKLHSVTLCLVLSNTV